MSWGLILNIHVHQNRIVLANGFHKVSTLGVRNFRPPSPPVYAHTVLAYTHIHNLVRAYESYILKKIWWGYIFCELISIKEPQTALKKLLYKAIGKWIKTPKISEIDYFVTNLQKKIMTYVCLNFKCLKFKCLKNLSASSPNTSLCAFS